MTLTLPLLSWWGVGDPYVTTAVVVGVGDPYVTTAVVVGGG